MKRLGLYLGAILLGGGGFWLLGKFHVISTLPYRPVMVSCMVAIVFVSSFKAMYYRRKSRRHQ